MPSDDETVDLLRGSRTEGAGTVALTTALRGAGDELRTVQQALLSPVGTAEGSLGIYPWVEGGARLVPNQTTKGA